MKLMLIILMLFTCATLTIGTTCLVDKLKHGKVIFNGNVMRDKFYIRYDQVVSYECNKGYKLKGSSTRLCKLNRRLTEDSPTCKKIVRCNVPTTLSNGKIKTKNDDNSLKVGDTVKFFCNYGYSLQGKQKATCQANGQLSNTTPYCKENRRGDCRLYAPVYGHITNPITFTAQLHQYVYYSCDVGYKIISGNSVRKCLSNGGLSGYIITCTKIAKDWDMAHCSSPKKIIGKYSDVTVSPSWDIYPHGSKVGLECASKYHTFSGYRTSRCSNGEWHPVPSGRCSAPEAWGKKHGHSKYN